MTRDEAVALVQEGLGFRTDLTTRIIQHMKDVQREYEAGALLPWWLVSEYFYRQTVVGEERLSLPTGYIRGVEDDAIWYYNADATEDADKWTALHKDDVETLRKTLPGTGAPEAYAELGAYFRIFPTPDDTYQIRQIFYQADDLLATNIENKWLLHVPDLIIGAAGVRMSGSARDKEAVQLFVDRESRGRAQLFMDTEAREHANQRYIMGDPD